MVVDLATGSRLVRVLNVIAAVGGIAPIVGPLVGAVILQLSHWRVSFWVVAALGVAMTVAVLVAVPETLAPDQRHGGGLRAFGVAGCEVLRNRRYVGYLVVSGSAMGALFAYVATSAFVLQSMNGLSPVAYSVDFAANASGMTLAAGIAMLAGAVWFDTPLVVALVSFFVLTTAQGLIGANGGALASARGAGAPGYGLGAARLRAVGRRRHYRAPRRPGRGGHRRADGGPDGRRSGAVHARATRPGPSWSISNP